MTILFPFGLLTTGFLALALLPAILLLVYTFRQDKIEKEPMNLLVRLIFMGVLAGFLSMALESVGTSLLNMTPIGSETKLYVILTCFLVVGAAEEGTKLLLMYKATWKHPAFNYTFDGVVYSVFTSLGFAMMENILYGVGFGPGVLVLRALLSIPGHMAFAVLSGMYYGRAKRYAAMGDHAKARSSIWTGYLMAVFLHGLYDTCATLDSVKAMVFFGLVVIAIYILIFRVLRREAREDQRI